MPNIHVIYIPFSSSKTKRLFSFLIAAIQTSRALKPDILYIVYFNACALLKWFCNGKIKILDIRTGSLEPKALKRNFGNSIITLQSLFFKKIIILSESLKNKLRILSTKTLILPLGAEIYYNGEHNYNSLNLLYIGTLDGREIHKTILGLSIYLIKFPEKKTITTYTIIGYGSENELIRINNVIAETNLNEIVKYVGRKKYSELTPYLEKANIGVSFIPITDFYNFQPPTKTYEYILNGLFTIATETYENKQIINSLNGILCKDNAISFYESIEFYYSNRKKISSVTIQNTLIDFEWSKLIETKLKPFLK